MTKKLAGLIIFLIAVFAVVPWLIVTTGRTDLYYVFTSVALLSIASAGVWLTFYIGRINIGQGAYALMGGYVSAILIMYYGWSFWWTLPVAGVFCALASILISPIYLAKFSNGETLGLIAFVAAIVGGFNQVRGAIAGGLLIGVLDNLAAA